MLRPALPWIMAAILAAVLGAQTAPRADVRWIDATGEAHREPDAEVVTNTLQAVTVRPKGKTQMTLPRDAAIEIRWLDRPDALVRAESHLRDQQWAAATKALSELLADTALAKAKPWIVEEAAYFAAIAAEHRGDQAAAMAAAAMLARIEEKSRRRLEVLWVGSADALARGDRKSGFAFFTEVEESPADSLYPRRFVARAFVVHAADLAAAGESDALDALLVRLKSAGLDDALAAPHVKLIEGERFLAKKLHREADRAFAESAGLAKGDTFILARAWLGRARVAVAEERFADADLFASRAPAMNQDEFILMHEVGESFLLWSQAKRKLGDSIADVKDPVRIEQLRRSRDLRRRAADDFPLTRGGIEAKKNRDR